MPEIKYFFATISPFTYLAGMRLEDIAARYGATIDYKPVDLVTLFARTGGVLPKERHISRQEYRAQDLNRQAVKAGLKFNIAPAHWPTNMAPASYAFIAARNAGGGDLGVLVHAMTRSCWADDKDIADDAVDVQVAGRDAPHGRQTVGAASTTKHAVVAVDPPMLRVATRSAPST